MIDITKPIYDRIETGDKTLDWILHILYQDKAQAEKEMKESPAKQQALSNFNTAINWLFKVSAEKGEIAYQKVIIQYLKNELIKKTYCRKVMKQQYRELKQRYEALKEKTTPKTAMLGRLRKISYDEIEKSYLYEDEFGRKAKSFDGETWQDWKE